MEEKKKQIRSTNKQLEKLAEYMSLNQEFANGEYTGPLGATKMEQKWLELKELLREVGPDKTVEQWKQTWRDLKRKARHSNAQASAARAKTGNTLVVPDVSDTHLRVLDTIGHECSTGIGPEESGIGRAVVIENVTGASAFCLTAVDAVPECLETIMIEDQTAQPLLPLNPTDPTTSSNSARSRRTRQVENAENTFVKLQKEHNDIMLKILDEFKKTNQLLKERNEIEKERRNQ